MDEKEYNSKFTSECKTWIVVIKFPDMETHTENVTSFGPFDNKNKALSWAFQVYEEEHVSIEVIPVNEPFDVNEFKKFDPDTAALVFAVGKKYASRLSSGKYFQD